MVQDDARVDQSRKGKCCVALRPASPLDDLRRAARGQWQARAAE